jgi:hypothetical protein
MNKLTAPALCLAVISGFLPGTNSQHHDALVPDQPHVPEEQYDPNTFGLRFRPPVFTTLSASTGHDIVLVTSDGGWICLQRMSDPGDFRA